MSDTAGTGLRDDRFPKPLDMACPKCDAAPGRRCRTAETAASRSRTTDTHIARFEAMSADPWAAGAPPAMQPCHHTTRRGERAPSGRSFIWRCDDCGLITHTATCRCWDCLSEQRGENDFAGLS